MNTPERPKWTLGSEELDASRAPINVDLAQVRQEALGKVCGYSGMQDPQSLTVAAAQYAATVMFPALVQTSLMSMQEGVVRAASGWELRPLSESFDHAKMAITHPTLPGGWVIDLEYDPVLTPEAAVTSKELWAEINRKMKEQGVSAHQWILRSLTKSKKDELPEERLLAALKKDPENHLPLTENHELRSLRAIDVILPTSLGFGTPGRRDDIERSSTLKEVLNVEKGDFLFGVVAEIGSGQEKLSMSELLRPSSSFNVAFPSAFMEVLSDLVRAAGMEDEVRAKNDEISRKDWMCFGSGNACALQEMGHVIVAEAGGFWDPSVSQHIAAFSADIAALDVSRNVDEWISLARNLLSEGHADVDNAFSANDGRDEAWAEETENGLIIRNETQHGKFKTKIEMRDGSPKSVICVRMRGESQEVPVGRFLSVPEGGFRADFEGISHTQRRVWDMNGITSSLNSLSCVLEDEISERDEPQI